MSCHKIDGEKCKKVIDSMMGVEEAETDGCTGYKSSKECPHNRIFNPLSNACKECIEDATIGYDTSDIL